MTDSTDISCSFSLLLAFPSHLSSAFLLVAELTAAFAFFVSSQTPRFMDEEYRAVLEKCLLFRITISYRRWAKEGRKVKK